MAWRIKNKEDGTEIRFPSIDDVPPCVGRIVFYKDPCVTEELVYARYSDEFFPIPAPDEYYQILLKVVEKAFRNRRAREISVSKLEKAKSAGIKVNVVSEKGRFEFEWVK